MRNFHLRDDPSIPLVVGTLGRGSVTFCASYMAASVLLVIMTPNGDDEFKVASFGDSL